MNADEKKVSGVEKIFGFEKKPSSMCSAEELRESVRQQLDDLKDGKIDFIPHEQLKKRQRLEPCMYTIEEIRAFLPKREKDIIEGKGISHDGVMKEYKV